MSINGPLISKDAPAAIGPYSQGVGAGNFVFLSGQIGLNIEGHLADGFNAQLEQVFRNIDALARAAGGGLRHVVRYTVYVTDMGNFPAVNDHMNRILPKPYPARVTIGVAQLPKGALVEVEATLYIAPSATHSSAGG